MPHRTIASLARAVTVGAAVTAAVAVLAPAASAFTGNTYTTNIQTPGSTTQSSLVNGTALVAALAAQTGGTGPGLVAGENNVVQLCNCDYVVASSLSIPANMQVEITGPPLLNATPTNFSRVEGTSGASGLKADLFVVNSGDNVLFKAFNIVNAPSGFAAIRTTGGNTEIDNFSMYNEFSNVMTVAGGNVTVNDTTIADNGQGSGITQTAGTLTVNNSTIGNNQTYGLRATNAFLNNDTFAQNPAGDCQLSNGGIGPGAGITANAGNLDDDGSCGGNADGSLILAFPSTFQGGPVHIAQIVTETSPGIDNITSGCPLEDARFYNVTNTTSCDPGSDALGNSTAPTETAGSVAPVSCSVKSTTEIPSGGTGSSMQVVGVTDATSYLGPDTFFGGTTNNGSISWPTVSGTLFDLTNPSFTGWTDSPTNGEFDVTAIKTAGDAAAGDTMWHLTAMDWLGNTKTC